MMKQNKLLLLFVLFLFSTFFSPLYSQVKNDTIVVARDGSGKFRNITEALESIRAYMDYTVVVYIKNGTYKEKIIIPSWLKNVELIGESKEGTIITYDDHANIDKMGTFRTYTLRVDGDRIKLKNLTIENNAAPMGQAVALHTEGNYLIFENCRILGNQDTIFTGREYSKLLFKDCYIEGTTDFIFGGATAFFDSCVIHSKRNSYITAASTPKDAPYGYVFHNCTLTANNGINKVFLGRPWRPYASTAFIKCYFGEHIRPEGWHNWGNADNEVTARYYESENYGPGSNTQNRVKWAKSLSTKEASTFNKEQVLEDPFFLD